MRPSHKKANLIVGACLGAVMTSTGGFATRVAAQNSAAPAEHPSITAAALLTPGADPLTDEDLQRRVQDALHSDPFFYDAHVAVSVEKGEVVLRGFVLGEWDLLDAIRIARKAAGKRRVINDLSIELGGRK
jgi:osmotically-inducible protein OsmY